MKEIMRVEAKGNIGIGTTTPKHLITISQTREEYKRNYHLRARVGLRILWLLGIIGFEWK